jgi:prephenate dehydrogenase
LSGVRDIVARRDREALHALLSRARAARANLPSRLARTADLAEVRVPVPDRPGAAAEVFTLAAELGVNIFDFEVFHSAEGDKGVMILVIEAASGELFRGGLIARGYRPGVRRLE